MITRDFESDVRAALGPALPGTLAGGLAFQRLSGALWDAANQYLDTVRYVETEQEIAVDHVSVARELEDRARELLQLLRKWRRRFLEGLARGYIVFTSDDVETLGEALRTGWPADWRAREALTRLADEANRWGNRAKGSAVKKRGRLLPSVRTRRHLATYVRDQLVAAGVPVPKSDKGTFARVLAVVHKQAGIPPANLYRDVSWVLEQSRPPAKR